MSAPRGKSNASMCLESLESRQLMSVSATLDNGVLVITGTEGADRVEVHGQSPHLLVMDHGGIVAAFEGRQVKTVRFEALGGDDLFFTNETVPMLVFGGAGNDTILGSGVNDVLIGGIGNDSILGGQGHDRIDADAGDDTVFGGEGNDTINGGSGRDLLVGDRGNDVINGGGDADEIYGGLDNDLISGEGGNDTLHGNDGRDTIKGGDGNDRIFAKDKARDVLDGGAGFDSAEVDKFLFFVLDAKGNIEQLL